jgi:hypothetical protein
MFVFRINVEPGSDAILQVRNDVSSWLRVVLFPSSSAERAERASKAWDPAQDSSQTQYRAFGTPHAGSPTRLAMLIASRMTGRMALTGI